MSATERLMVVSPLETVTVGESFRSIPVHVTEFPWFDLAMRDWARFHQEMEWLAGETRSINLTVGPRGFEDDPSAEVWRFKEQLEPSDEMQRLRDLQAGVARVARQYGSGADETYMRNWNPHISDKGELDVQEGESVSINNLAVFQLGEEKRKIVKGLYFLRGQSD